MTKAAYPIRALRESDLSEWLRLRKLLWDENAEDDHRAEMFDILGHPESQLVLVAEDGEKLVGFLEASIRPFVEDCETDNVGYLEGWFVESEYRQGGIGRDLVANAENWAAQKGCTEMASDAEVGNDLSLNAHMSVGYVVTSNLIHMKKNLL